MMTESSENASGSAGGEIVLYSAPGGDVRVECLLHDETIWLTQQQIADLFSVDNSGVSRHLKNIYNEGELARESAVAKIATTAADGKNYQVEYHSLDAIIAVGYRVSSYQATQFRIWATKTLKELVGWALVPTLRWLCGRLGGMAASGHP